MKMSMFVNHRRRIFILLFFMALGGLFWSQSRLESDSINDVPQQDHPQNLAFKRIKVSSNCIYLSCVLYQHHQIRIRHRNIHFMNQFAGQRTT